jgi:hypothetical protein
MVGGLGGVSPSSVMNSRRRMSALERDPQSSTSLDHEDGAVQYSEIFPLMSVQTDIIGGSRSRCPVP